MNPEKIGKAVSLWSQYTKGADQLEARAFRTGDAEAMRKAIVFRQNAATLAGYLSKHAMVKGFPLQKKFKWQGMQVSIENAAGTSRNWYDPHAKRNGYTYMLHDYGYLRGTEGVDGDHVDCFFGPIPESAPHVYVVRQMKSPDFHYYDEDKCMIGFSSEAAAAEAYKLHYDDPRFLGVIDTYPVDTFLSAVKQTKKAPSPVGGWLSLRVQQRMADLVGTSALPKEAKVFSIENAPPLPETSPMAMPEAGIRAWPINPPAIGPVLPGAVPLP